MIKSIIKVFVFALILGFLSACFELKEAGRSIGHTAKNVTTDIGHGSRDTVKVLGHGTKRVVKSIINNPSRARD